MTWDEFKAVVDSELTKQGADGSASIMYIDVGHTENPCVEVEIDDSEPQDPFTEFRVYG